MNRVFVSVVFVKLADDHYEHIETKVVTLDAMDFGMNDFAHECYSEFSEGYEDINNILIKHTKPLQNDYIITISFFAEAWDSYNAFTGECDAGLLIDNATVIVRESSITYEEAEKMGVVL